MTRPRAFAFGAWDFVVGDDCRTVVGVVAGLGLTALAATRRNRERQPDPQDHQGNAELPSDRRPGESPGQSRADLGSGKHADREGDRPAQAVADRQRAGDKMGDAPGPRHEDGNEMRGGGGDVHRDAERADQQRDVDDAAADAEEAREEADPDAVGDAAADRDPVGIDRAAAVDEVAPSLTGRDRPLGVGATADHVVGGAGQHDGHDRVEGPDRDEADGGGAGDRAGQGGEGELGAGG